MNFFFRNKDIDEDPHGDNVREKLGFCSGHHVHRHRSSRHSDCKNTRLCHARSRVPYTPNKTRVYTFCKSYGFEDVNAIPQHRVTGNSLATTVLLDCTLALRTFLGVALDPIRRFAVVATFLEPHLGDVAHHWSMIALDWASKTELVFLALEAESKLLAP